MKHLVITGGRGGLGKAVADAFSGPDWAVAPLGRTELDVCDEAAVSAFFASQPVDLLVCAAGWVRDAPLLGQSEKDRDRILAVNFKGAAECAKAVLPDMLRRKRGHIIFISSHSALHPPNGQTAYAAAKAGLLGLAASLASQYGGDGIRINTVVPGLMETPMTSGISFDRREAIRHEHVLRRFNTPEAVASFIRHLEECLPHTSGQIFQLDSRPSGP